MGDFDESEDKGELLRPSIPDLLLSFNWSWFRLAGSVIGETEK